MTVTICYILGTVCVLLALPSIGGQQSARTGAGRLGDRASRVGFPGVLPLAAFLIALSNMGAAGAYLAAVARLPFVAGLDRFSAAGVRSAAPKMENTMGCAADAVRHSAWCLSFLGQAGTSVKGAYDVLVSMGVITYFIPYLYLFAAMIKLQREPAGPEVIRVPGGNGDGEAGGHTRILHDGADDRSYR